MKLIIVHFHLRPGGVRTVIELATPFLLREMPSIERVILATGEARDADWNAEFRRRLAPTPIELMVEPTFRYISEQTSTPTLAGRIRRALERLLASAEPALVWAHNLSVGRNLILARELVSVCDMHERTIVMHHHDWWFDNRWRRWPEMRRLGIRTLREAARIVFPTKPCIRIATINRADASVLQRHFGKRAAWLPNLAERAPAPSAARVRAARAWLSEVIGDHAPVWLLPSRLLRRKNIAEALLLTRWLRPEAALVVTGGVSSADENSYAQRLADATRRHHWRLHFGVLSSDDRRQPSVRELLAASECVLITSVQEGFGLPFVEAADSARPLIARHLPNVMPDLAKFGFRFPHTYEEVLIAPSLFSWTEEHKRQRRFFREWKAQLPRVCSAWTKPPPLLAHETPRPIPFSRLTLTAQLEVLARPAAESWRACAPLNESLRTWKRLASVGGLHITPWPASAKAWIGGPAYARRFAALAGARSQDRPAPDAAITAQDGLLPTKLRSQLPFPLPISPNP
ncbi:MAG TPA: glycosyltransferase [Chthoniobacteraceae bacterium]|nr:glycosyltransferase [Chthoniobacteraceae bacterium]